MLVALCPDEQLASLEVADNATLRPIWKVSNPIGPMRRGGWISLGESDEFEVQDISLPVDVPQNIAATAQLTNGHRFGSAFVRDEIPQDMAGTGRVLNPEGKEVAENEFLREVRDEYC
ncbi:hypothetical protein AB0O34_22775 [Sphaerisporangium sp. NPDC088356]|uniref:hypothetical protein n=1 Tax=Sphaerisporangium sp. NPDC088356 TaxID=3154871 RepID=UPI003440B79C